MIDDLALGGQAATSSARIHALEVAACLILQAVGADQAFWPAIWRAAQVAPDAGAHTLAVNGSALAVGSTGGRIAGVDVHDWIRKI